jgi:hypothetical protein
MPVPCEGGALDIQFNAGYYLGVAVGICLLPDGVGVHAGPALGGGINMAINKVLGTPSRGWSGGAGVAPIPGVSPNVELGGSRSGPHGEGGVSLGTPGVSGALYYTFEKIPGNIRDFTIPNSR